MPYATWMIPVGILLYAAVLAVKKGPPRPNKMWIAPAAIVFCLLVFGARWSGSGAVTLCVCAVLGYVVLRWRRESKPAPAVTPYLADVHYAISVLTDEERRFALFDVVGLSVRRMDKHGRFERWMPPLVSLNPTVFGASARFGAVDGQELADWQRASGRLATALMVPAAVVTQPKPGVFQLDMRALDPLETPVILEYPKALSHWSFELGRDESGDSAVADWVNRFASLSRDPAQLLHNRLAQPS